MSTFSVPIQFIKTVYSSNVMALAAEKAPSVAPAADKPAPGDVNWAYAFLQFIEAWRQTPTVTQIAVILGVVIIVLAIVFSDKKEWLKKIFGKGSEDKGSDSKSLAQSSHQVSDNSAWENVMGQSLTELSGHIASIASMIERHHEQLEKDNDQLKSLIAENLSAILDLTNEIRRVRIVPLSTTVIQDATLEELQGGKK